MCWSHCPWNGNIMSPWVPAWIPPLLKRRISQYHFTQSVLFHVVSKHSPASIIFPLGTNLSLNNLVNRAIHISCEIIITSWHPQQWPQLLKQLWKRKDKMCVWWILSFILSHHGSMQPQVHSIHSNRELQSESTALLGLYNVTCKKNCLGAPQR